MEYIKLSNGVEMPQIGYEVYQVDQQNVKDESAMLSKWTIA